MYRVALTLNGTRSLSSPISSFSDALNLYEPMSMMLGGRDLDGKVEIETDDNDDGTWIRVHSCRRRL